jgi:aspartate/methionine/tyrosine aminotransferase
MSKRQAAALPPIAGLMEDPGIGTTDDARMIATYLASGGALPPLAMGIGDPYLLGGTLPTKLGQYERSAPYHLAGYSRTPAGLPEARRMITEWTVRGQQLDGHASQGTDFDLHITSGTGTRGIMGDFGRFLRDAHPAEDTRTPVVLCPTPTWDYAGVFQPLGYKMIFWPLRAENAWLPDAQDIEAQLAAIDANPTQRLALVVVNAQHNPTGGSWSADILRKLFKAATDRDAGILLDDPYRLVVTDEAQPVSAPAVLFEYLSDKKTPAAAKQRWCRVESFGKAFSCNDWGIGTVMAHPDVLQQLAAYTFQWAFPKASRRQWAMAHWLTDPACDRYIAKQRAALGRKRALWAKTLQKLGWPKALTPVGMATPYYLIALPPHFAARPDGIREWRQHIMDTTGMLLSYASIEQEDTDADMPYLRAYLGGGEPVVAEAAKRLVNAGITYEQSAAVDKKPIPDTAPHQTEAYAGQDI